MKYYYKQFFRLLPLFLMLGIEFIRFAVLREVPHIPEIVLSLLIIGSICYSQFHKKRSQLLLSLSFLLQLFIPLIWSSIFGMVLKGASNNFSIIVLLLLGVIFYWYNAQALLAIKQITRTWLQLILVLLSFFVISNNVVSALQTLDLPKLWDRVLITGELGIALILFPFFVQWRSIWKLPKLHFSRLADVTVR